MVSAKLEPPPPAGGSSDSSAPVTKKPKVAPAPVASAPVAKRRGAVGGAVKVVPLFDLRDDDEEIMAHHF